MIRSPRHSLPVLLACAVCFAPAAAFADELPAEPPPPAPALPPFAIYGSPPAPPPPLSSSAAELPPEDAGPYEPHEGSRPRYGMRRAGIVLTCVGIGVAAIGGIVLGASVSSGGGGRSGEWGPWLRQLGIGVGGVMLGGGGASILTGIPLWAVGAASIPSSPQP